MAAAGELGYDVGVHAHGETQIAKQVTVKTSGIIFFIIDNHLLKLEQTRALQVLSDMLDNQQRWHLAWVMGTARQIRDRKDGESVDW